jgi:hypothetical protein
MKPAKQKPDEPSKQRTRPAAKPVPTTGRRFTISDELWALREPLLAEHKNTQRFGGRRPRVPERVCADAIFYRAENRLPMERAGLHQAVRLLHGARAFSTVGRRRLFPALLAGGPGGVRRV